MKTKILFTLLFGLFSLAGFSQEMQKAEKDSLTSDLKSNPFENHVDILDWDANNQPGNFPEIENHFKVPELNSDRLLSENQNSIDNMPVYKPWKNDNMPVAAPDTAIDYKLKIKKYNGVIVKPNENR